jgi:hypothetical protein
MNVLKIIDYNISLQIEDGDSNISVDVVDATKVFYEMVTGLKLTGKSEEIVSGISNSHFIPITFKFIRHFFR